MVLAERLVLSLSSVIGRFRSLYCSRLEVGVSLVKLSLSVRTPLVGLAYVVGRSLVKRRRSG